MQYFLASLCVFGLLIGCGDRANQSTATADSTVLTTNRTETACYRQVQGRDTTLVRLVTNGTDVTGELAVMPAEKDRASGPISGTLTGNQVRADWQRSGEGSTQTHEVTFTLMDSTVSWREGERIEKNGKWTLRNPDKGYEYVLTKVACP